jgi:phosphoribosylanthranilate isomerase
VFVKVCGLKTDWAVAAAVEASADAIGFVLTESTRQIDPLIAGRLAARVPGHILTVGVFNGVRPAAAARVAADAGLRAVQVHGAFGREDYAEVANGSLLVIRAISQSGSDEYQTGAYGESILLIDAPVPGSGRPWVWSEIDRRRPAGRWLLAGGLNPGNVRAAINQARPWGVDASSGMESAPGVKDPALIRAFVLAAQSAASGLAGQAS